MEIGQDRSERPESKILVSIERGLRRSLHIFFVREKEHCYYVTTQPINDDTREKEREEGERKKRKRKGGGDIRTCYVDIESEDTTVSPSVEGSSEALEALMA